MISAPAMSDIPQPGMTVKSPMTDIPLCPHHVAVFANNPGPHVTPEERAEQIAQHARQCRACRALTEPTKETP